MDQEKCYHVDDFDPSTVNLAQPATTVDEYLKQVVVNRMNCTDVAFAKIHPSKIKSQSGILLSGDLISSRTNDKCPFAPDRKWQDDFVSLFENNNYFC